MKREFPDKYEKAASIHPAILRNIYQFLTNNASAAATSHAHEVDDRVVKFPSNADDPSLQWRGPDRRGPGPGPHLTLCF
jgi:hypothetical protein